MAATQTKPHGNPRNFVQGTVTALNDAIALGGFVTGGVIAIQLTGTWTGTITFEATLDNTTWDALSLTPSNGSTATTTATANGLWGDVAYGWKAVRARFSASPTGTPTITINYNPSQF